MADVSISYKGNTIATMDNTGSKTLQTAGTYCEGDISVSYAPRSRTYEITLQKSSGDVLLLELDDDVLTHINEPGMVVSLLNVSGYKFESYSVALLIVSNTPFAMYGESPVYGITVRQANATATTIGRVTCPANNTDVNIANINIAWFRLDGRNYYVTPADGFIRYGTYRLTFAW